eukprot:3151879-Amphidinium_carterae.1
MAPLRRAPKPTAQKCQPRFAGRPSFCTHTCPRCMQNIDVLARLSSSTGPPTLLESCAKVLGFAFTLGRLLHLGRTLFYMSLNMCTSGGC